MHSIRRQAADSFFFKDLMGILNDAIKHAHKIGYRVNEDGFVISPTGKMLKLRDGNKGKRSKDSKRLSYKRFNVNFFGQVTPLAVHRFAAYQLFGEEMFKEGIQVRHLDNDHTNNKLKNIGLGTRLENSNDRPAHERQAHAQLAAEANRVYSQEIVALMKKRRAEGASLKTIVAEFGCAISTASILTRNSVRPD